MMFEEPLIESYFRFKYIVSLSCFSFTYDHKCVRQSFVFHDFFHATLKLQILHAMTEPIYVL